MLNVLEKGKPENWPPFFCLAGGDPTGGAVSRGSGQSSLRLLRLRFGPLLLRAVRRGDQRQTAGLSGSTLHRLPAAVQRLHSRCNTQIFIKKTHFSSRRLLESHFKLGCFVFPVRCGGHPGEAGRQQEEEKNHRKFPKRWLPGESKHEWTPTRSSGDGNGSFVKFSASSFVDVTGQKGCYSEDVAYGPQRASTLQLGINSATNTWMLFLNANIIAVKGDSKRSCGSKRSF